MISRNKKQKRYKKLEQKLEKIYSESYNFEYGQKQKEIIKEIRNTSKTSKQERKILEQLKKNAKEDIDEWDKDGNPINKFRFRHIDNLGVPYDVFFMYGKKGIGKTVQIREYCRNLLAQDPKSEIFLIRNTKEELVALEAQLNNSTGDPNRDWPCILVNERLYEKQSNKKKNLRLCGYATYVNASGLIKWKGGEYANVRAIIWDECNNESEAFKLNKNAFLKFINFVSSIVRDKKHVKIYMFGNLLRNSDGTVSNPILRAMGIDQNTELKLISVPTIDGSDTTNIIYWNSLNAYQGIEKGKLTTIFKNVDITELETNAPQPYVGKILSDSEWVDTIPIHAYVFTHKQEKLCLFFSYFEYLENDPERDSLKFPPGKYYAIRIENYDPQITYGYYLSSTEVSIRNNNPGLIQYIEESDWIDFLENLHDISEIGKIWYGTEETELLFTELMKQWTKSYKLAYEDRETF